MAHWVLTVFDRRVEFRSTGWHTVSGSQPCRALPLTFATGMKLGLELGGHTVELLDRTSFDPTADEEG